MTRVISDPESVEAALSDLARTTEEILTLEELQQLLVSGQRLRMKYGVDLTAPQLHRGHAVSLWLYRRLQEPATPLSCCSATSPSRSATRRGAAGPGRCSRWTRSSATPTPFSGRRCPGLIWAG